jgi:hypothetical protein
MCQVSQGVPRLSSRFPNPKKETEAQEVIHVLDSEDSGPESDRSPMSILFRTRLGSFPRVRIPTLTGEMPTM